MHENFKLCRRKIHSLLRNLHSQWHSKELLPPFHFSSDNIGILRVVGEGETLENICGETNEFLLALVVNEALGALFDWHNRLHVKERPMWLVRHSGNYFRGSENSCLWQGSADGQVASNSASRADVARDARISSGTEREKKAEEETKIHVIDSISIRWSADSRKLTSSTAMRIPRIIRALKKKFPEE